jgi:hypothetical protein
LNRKRRFLAGLWASYTAFGANFLFTLLSVPLALHFLPKTEFGLWALVAQIGGYLALLDMGMTSSVARFLADHKDPMDCSETGKILQPDRWIFGFQAGLDLRCQSGFFFPSCGQAEPCHKIGAEGPTASSGEAAWEFNVEESS